MSTKNIYSQKISTSRQKREGIKNQIGTVVWITGLSGSGKSKLADQLEIELNRLGKHTYILDGDNIRLGLNKDLGFRNNDRTENIRRISEVAKLMADAGLIVMVAFISPLKKDRQMARDIIGSEIFIEVFMDTPIEICEKRDKKGLYKKARKDQISNMPGINSPYEPPENPRFIFNQNSDLNMLIKLIELPQL